MRGKDIGVLLLSAPVTRERISPSLDLFLITFTFGRMCISDVVNWGDRNRKEGEGYVAIYESITKVINYNDLMQELRRRPIKHRLHCSQENWCPLVVLYYDHLVLQYLEGEWRRIKIKKGKISVEKREGGETRDSYSSLRKFINLPIMVQATRLTRQRNISCVKFTSHFLMM